ncbi:hypothetical protein, partial [Nonomuraea sp. NPDC059022]|uniref:hypothetical protein n=1 Tax=Nonomuraea sp. NPDC059022 TaxID=3346705 RepID=UPI0036AD22D0
MAKNFEQMDKHNRGNAAKAALAARFDKSRAVPFDAPLAKLAQNPLNRREQDDPEVQEMAVSLKQGQEQIATVVTREAFLEAYPDEEENVPVEAEWVRWKGNRRL